MRLILTAMLMLVPTIAYAQVSKQDILKLKRAGAGDDLILSFLQAKGVKLELSSDDIADLKSAGVGDRVISGLLGKVLTPAPRSVAPRTRVVYEVRNVPRYSHYRYGYRTGHYRYRYGYRHHGYGHHGYGFGLRYGHHGYHRYRHH